MPKKQEKRRILMIEDDGDFQSIVKGWLDPHYDVDALSSGEGLLEEIDELDPDLILMDVRLPGPSGFKLCSSIRADPRFSDIPILFLTGCSEDVDFIKSLKVGGTAYLIKPVSRKQLLGEIEELVSQPYEKPYEMWR